MRFCNRILYFSVAVPKKSLATQSCGRIGRNDSYNDTAPVKKTTEMLVSDYHLCSFFP